MNPLDQIIHDINYSSSSTEFIKNKELLLDSLNELNGMIGHQRLKNSIGLQCMQLIKKARQGKLDSSMLNTVIYGPPGVGKTHIGKILAKIWHGIGFLKKTHKIQTSEGFNILEMIESQSYKDITYIDILPYIVIYVLFYWIKYFDKINYNVSLVIIFIVLIAILVWLLFRVNKNSVEETKDIKDIKENPLLYPHNEEKNNLNDIVKSLENFHENPVKDTPEKKIDRGNDKIFNDLCVLASRENFVGQYLGETSIKTKKFLQENSGKVIIVDEAYSLMTDSTDSYGAQALTTINLHMSEYPDSTCMIFLGYRDIMEKTIFKMQPGLPRRFMWHFDCEGYDHKELFEILISQMNSKDLEFTPSDILKIKRLFRRKIDLFPSFGGDTLRLCNYLDMELAQESYLDSSSDESQLVSIQHFKKGLSKLKENNILSSHIHPYDEKKDKRVKRKKEQQKRGEKGGQREKGERKGEKGGQKEKEKEKERENISDISEDRQKIIQEMTQAMNTYLVR